MGLPVSTRDELIARKGEVQGRMRSLRPKLEVAQASVEATTGVRQRYYAARLASLQAELDGLMAEEARLRVEIDRSPR
ncbi:MAG: hypothetical protein ACM30E_10090 [Nitrososphaerales archaeon]